jgi:hypothetical protein
MLFISPSKEYPLHYGDIQLASPGWEPGDTLPKGWQQVAYGTPPELGDNQIWVELEPVEIDGVLTQNLVAKDMTAEQLEIKQAPISAKAKLVKLGFTELEIAALGEGLNR